MGKHDCDLVLSGSSSFMDLSEKASMKLSELKCGLD